MSPQPPSPTSLLWAYELKREQKQLLQRIKFLETQNQQLNEQMRVAGENIAKLVTRLDSFQNTVTAIQHEQDEQKTRAQTPELPSSERSIRVLVVTPKQRNSSWYV